MKGAKEHDNRRSNNIDYMRNTNFIIFNQQKGQIKNANKKENQTTFIINRKKRNAKFN